MESYEDALVTRAHAISAKLVADLFNAAGGQKDAVQIAATTGLSLSLLNEWATGHKPISLCEFQYLAIALDLHPLYTRNTRKQPPWRISPDAARQYQHMHLEPCELEDAVDDLAEMVQEIVTAGTQPRTNPDLTHTFRGPKPWRLALDVRAQGGGWELFQVRPPNFGGLHVTVDRRKTRDFDPHSFRDFISAHLASIYAGSEVSASVGTTGMLVGVAREHFNQALDLYCNEELEKMREQVMLLDQSIISWTHNNDRDRNANIARVASLGILQLASLHPKILKLESMEKAMLERLSILKPNEWHEVLKDYQAEAMRCARRLAAHLRR